MHSTPDSLRRNKLDLNNLWINEMTITSVVPSIVVRGGLVDGRLRDRGRARARGGHGGLDHGRPEEEVLQLDTIWEVFTSFWFQLFVIVKSRQRELSSNFFDDDNQISWKFVKRKLGLWWTWYYFRLRNKNYLECILGGGKIA